MCVCVCVCKCAREGGKEVGEGEGAKYERIRAHIYK